MGQVSGLPPKPEPTQSEEKHKPIPQKGFNRFFTEKLRPLTEKTGHVRQKIVYITVLGSSGVSAVKTFFSDMLYRISNQLTRLFKVTVYSEQAKLLKGHEKIDAYHQEWFLNLSLLRDAADSLPADSPERERIQFMAANYLHKTAPVHMKTMKLFFGKIAQMFQTSHYENKDNLYHRFSLKYQVKMAAGSNKKLSMSKQSPLILTDTAEFQHLLPLRFHVTEKIDDSIGTVLMRHFEGKDPVDALKSHFSSPILFDLTNSLGSELSVENELEFKRKLSEFTADLRTSIASSVDEFIRQNPQLSKHKHAIKELIQKNITCICRVDREDIKGLKVLPLFADISGTKVLKAHHDLADFIVSTGISIGSVSARRLLLNAFSERKDVQYAPQGPTSTLYYPTLTSFTDTVIFKRLSKLFSSTQLTTEKPHIALLGKATMDLLSGLLNKVDDQKWEQLHSNPAYRTIIQTTLFKIREQLANAELNQNNYTVFAQQIELVQSEIATLLELVQPYKEQDFQEIYKRNLAPNIPPGLLSNVKAGLGKTAVNIFAGINDAVRQMNPNPSRIYSRGFYFEQAGFIGYDSTFDNAIQNQDPAAKKIDLYCGQFNSNIEIASDFTHYERRDIAADVKALLESGKAAKHLTVAVDCTIDQYNSTNIHQLLQQFEKEIKEGKVNFVFFRSGQKMDMLGMDNFYGAPFYMVNNGASQWQPFEGLLKNTIHKTDPLSNQWFCLSNEYIPDSLAAYRKLIFDNTRYILDRIPEKLKPAHNDQIRVNTADTKMNACFIDVKVLGKNHRLRSIVSLGMFYKKMIKMKIKLQTRATFGLYHPNGLIISINEVEGSSSMRLHPGINPEENDAFVQYFQKLAKTAY